MGEIAVGDRCLIRMGHLDDLLEIKVIEISPSGLSFKLEDLNLGTVAWLNCAKFSIVEILP